MQGMLDNLSQPVAFATAPLVQAESSTRPSTPGRTTISAQRAQLRRDGSVSSDTDIEEPLVSRFTKRLGMNKKPERSPSNLAAGPSKPSSLDVVDLDEELFDEG